MKHPDLELPTVKFVLEGQANALRDVGLERDAYIRAFRELCLATSAMIRGWPVCVRAGHGVATCMHHARYLGPGNASYCSACGNGLSKDARSKLSEYPHYDNVAGLLVALGRHANLVQIATAGHPG